jgi:UPF0755 protein
MPTEPSTPTQRIERSATPWRPRYAGPRMTEPIPSASRRSARNPRRTGLSVLAVLGLVIVLAAGGAALWGVNRLSWCGSASGPKSTVTFTVEEGTSGSQVLSDLGDQGVVRSCGIITRYLAKDRIDGVQAGSYDLTTNMTLAGALKVLEMGPPPVETVSATFPEGLTVDQTAQVAADDLGIPAGQVRSLAESGQVSLPPYLPEGTRTAEGFLFPKTYEFLRGKVGARELVDKMLGQFEQEVKGLPWGNAKKLGISPYEAVVIASMIEREAANDAERPKIASVIYNRLSSGTPLYIDATLNYIDPDPSDGLTVSDLAIKSPYNTRLVKGLPPTPIASPGFASIKAALQPAHTAYEYYILCGNSHRFTASYAQFNAWKDQCL